MHLPHLCEAGDMFSTVSDGVDLRSLQELLSRAVNNAIILAEIMSAYEHTNPYAHEQNT